MTSLDRPPTKPAWESPVRKFSYESSLFLLRLIFAAGPAVRTTGLENLPLTGPAILASNHISHFDPPILSMISPRPIDWIAMQELYTSPLLRKYFLSLNAIPIRRGTSDRQALREATARLAAGRLIGIFPEGGIRDGAASVLEGAPFRKGISLLARLSMAPVIPCAIIGSDRLYNYRSWFLWRKTPVWIAFGQRIPAELRETEFQNALTKAFIGLKDHLVRNHNVTPADLPHSPQARMREP